MTIKEAVEILNREKHHGVADWYVGNLPDWELVVSPSVTMRLSGMSFFEAVAIAEKYEREKPA